MNPTRRLARLTVALGAAALVVAGGPVSGSASAQGAGKWASIDDARIHPGVQMVTAGAQCTANFVFTDKRGRVYIGYSAHCAGTGESSDTNGCESGSVPLGTRVQFFQGGSVVTAGEKITSGALVYSSWLTMQKLGTTKAAACEYNDFALVKVSKRKARMYVNPTMPTFGGPVGINTAGLEAPDRVFTFGNSGLRGGAEPFQPKEGVSLGDDPSGWSHEIYTATPGIPGDSGSGVLDAQGRAVGTLSTLQIAPTAGANGAGDLYRELRFAKRHSGIAGLRLVRGTEPFVG